MTMKGENAVENKDSKVFYYNWRSFSFWWPSLINICPKILLMPILSYTITFQVIPHLAWELI